MPIFFFNSKAKNVGHIEVQSRIKTTREIDGMWGVDNDRVCKRYLKIVRVREVELTFLSILE
jgi:hypothetical protein